MSRDSSMGHERGALGIIEELLTITRKMSESDDVDYIVEAIDRRGDLMEKYDRLKATNRYFAESIEKNRPQIGKLVTEILKLDEAVNKTLSDWRDLNKHSLESSVARSKVLKYANSSMSSAGSYMDFKK